MTDFDKLSTAFISSFKAQPDAFFNPDIEITDLRSHNEGRGIVATTDIPPDTDLFIIPRDFVISVENSDLAQRLPKIFDEAEFDDEKVAKTAEDVEDALIELPKPWLDLILVLIYEFFHRNDHDSKWKAYWNVLPETFDTLMFWTEDELAELQASTARTKIGKEDADQMFRRKILPVLIQHADVFYPEGVQRLPEEELLRLAHRMGSLIMAYAFDLESEGAEEEDGEEDGWAEDREGKTAMGMVPMADMLNADAEFNAHLEHGEKDLTMRSLRDIKKGEEVLNYYGPLPNSDLLRRYGYTSHKHARYDVVEVKWELVRKAIEEVFGLVPVVDVNDGEMEESFVLERESGDPDETGVNNAEAKFTTFPEELVDQVTKFASAALQIRGKPNEEQKLRLKQSFLQVMAKALPARRAEYATTVEQDEELLQQRSVAGRKKMAVDVRLGEKRLLKEAEGVVAELLKKYSFVKEDGSASERPTKKQKTKR